MVKELQTVDSCMHCSLFVNFNFLDQLARMGSGDEDVEERKAVLQNHKDKIEDKIEVLKKMRMVLEKS